MDVNKVTSWDDVLANNFSTETQAQGEEQKKAEDQQSIVETEAKDETVLTDDTNKDSEENQQTSTDDSSDTNGPVVVGDDVQETVATPETTQVVETKVGEDKLEPEVKPFNISDLNEDELYEYLSLKRTNYKEIPDMDIVSGMISSDNPNWDSEDVEFELEQKYGSALFEEKIDLETIDSELYPDEYKEAVKLNKEIDKAQKLLKRDAAEMRAKLEEMKENIKLPTSVVNTADNKSEDSKVETESSTELSQEQIEILQKNWIESVEREVPSVEEFKFKLEDEDVFYKITDTEKQEMVQKMKEFNAESYLVKRGWVNQDGTPNVKKITEDVYILENSEKMFKSGWTQAKEKAKMDIIGKDIKNVDFSSPKTSFDSKGGNPYDFGDYVLGL